jgi:hypothetical protein
LAPWLRAIVAPRMTKSAQTRERDAHEFAMEMANIRLEAARRRADFWEEMLIEVKLLTAGLAEDAAKLRAENTDFLRHFSFGRPIAWRPTGPHGTVALRVRPEASGSNWGR